MAAFSSTGCANAGVPRTQTPQNDSAVSILFMKFNSCSPIRAQYHKAKDKTLLGSESSHKRLDGQRHRRDNGPEDGRENWMNAPAEMALSPQRPPPAGALRIVATDMKQDPK